MTRNAIITAVGVAVAVIIVTGVLMYYNEHTVREPYAPDPELDEIVREMYNLHPKVKDLVFSEGNKSYTINKKNVYICMRDENDKYYDRNFLKFVVLHEISHALCDEIGHTPKFTRIFGDVLERAARLGIYDPNGMHIEDYCNYKKK